MLSFVSFLCNVAWSLVINLIKETFKSPTKVVGAMNELQNSSFFFRFFFVQKLKWDTIDQKRERYWIHNFLSSVLEEFLVKRRRNCWSCKVHMKGTQHKRVVANKDAQSNVIGRPKRYYACKVELLTIEYNVENSKLNKIVTRTNRNFV